ncbi:unnamed protein product [Anisakis simplex]|uniref:pantothenate kinase n=1 Tax=Anisakis simplex TaxID=6269 RepID=A0A0M3K836_ANISI|nr:unnamed protein product [Anisakis simplex]
MNTNGDQYESTIVSDGSITGLVPTVSDENIVRRTSPALSGDGDSPVKYRTPYAVLPSTESFEDVGRRTIYAIDCGGSLVKVVYTCIEEDENTNELESRLKFRKFQRIEHCLEFIRAHSNASGYGTIESPIMCTGGGAFKYEALIGQTLNLKVEPIDEMAALVKGCCFLLKYIKDESFTYHHDEEPFKQYQYRPIEQTVAFPFQLVNIGTGISVIKIESENEFARIGGSTMGGGAFTGLGSLLTSAKSFDDLLKKAEKGDHRNVDTLVADIASTSHDTLGLPDSLIAGSFGKCVDMKKRDELRGKEQSENDMTKSLLLMFSNSIGQMATLYGKQHQVKRIYFGGYFIRKHPLTMRTISYAVNYWSKGEIEALFLKHEGYIGAVGAFLEHLNQVKSDSS